MTAGRRWDPTLFAGAAQFYEQGRSPYAEGLADAFGTALGADGSGRLLDVGCGPGSIALRLTHRYREVIGIDPDPGMIGEARRLATGRRLGGRSASSRRAMRTMSSSTPHLFGDRLPDFRTELRELLTAASPHGHFSVQLPDTELKIWRAAA